MRLNLTSSAVSHGLGRLRRMLNDPLFLRTPKGVVPTARALALAEPVADLLARARNVLASAEPFDPAAIDAALRHRRAGRGVGVPAPLLAVLRDRAPGIDIGLRQLLPPQGGHSVERAWTPVFAELEAGSMDIAVAPIDRAPPRFVVRTIYDEDFVVVARARHPFAARPTLQRFCQMQHLVVSKTADPHGFVDDALAELGLARRVALTVPDFASALATVAETDLIAAMPRRFVAMHAARFAVVSREVPLRLRAFTIKAAVPKVGADGCRPRLAVRAMGEAVQGGGAKAKAPGGGSRRVMIDRAKLRTAVDGRLGGKRLCCGAGVCPALATGAEPAGDPQVDPAPCVAAAAADDADKTIAVCGALIDNEKTREGRPHQGADRARRRLRAPGHDRPRHRRLRHRAAARSDACGYLQRARRTLAQEGRPALARWPISPPRSS